MPDYVAKTAGSYQVSVTNSIGCSSTSTAVTVTITPPPTANITAKGATTFCSGDSVLLQADTSKTYTYKWMLGGSAISGATTDKFYAKTGGNYTVKVSSGCSATSSATLITINTSPSKPSITNVGALGFCSGDSVILLTTVGSGESAQWIKNTTDISGATSSSITVKSAGDYAVRLTNKTGCSSTSNVAKVTTGIKPTATATLGGKSTICSGDSSLISANSGTGYSYQWQLDGKDVSGATNQNHYAKAGGDYTVIVSDGGCKNTSSAVKITVNAGPTKPSISISGTVLTSTATTNNQWYRNDTLISGATNQTYTATVSGKYRVVVTDAGGCSTSSDPLGVSITAIEVSTSNFNLKIYPNPFKEMINVEYTLTEASQVQILITDITGKEIVKENLSHADAGQHTYNFNPSEFGLNSNLYIVKMIIGNTVVSKPVLHIK
ncbi:MAG: T9SS type A sorting domain-containing protein [Bacteroidetes bacterium]|nr:T9SS type A sorting domain-containing protein [Bacteroidota bacterium]